MYLMIENTGEAPLEAFTLLGDSGTRACDMSGVIGQFGSGTKHAINVLLRQGLGFTIYSGLTRLDFFSEESTVVDACGTVRPIERVKCRKTGPTRATIDCGWTLGFGELDWDSVDMALREFISNALDCTKIMTGDFSDPSLVIEKQVNLRAKAGCTRVFINMNTAVKSYLADLPVHFLHFSDHPLDQKFLAARPGEVKVYREGVLVRRIPTTLNPVHNINFSGTEIKIDECRNSSESAIRYSMAEAYQRAPVEALEQLFLASSKGPCYADTLDSFYLGYCAQEESKQVWQQAWKNTFGEDTLMVGRSLSESALLETARKKGLRVQLVSNCLAEAGMGIPNLRSALSIDETLGRETVPTTQHARDAVNTVWGWLEDCQLTRGVDMPKVQSYRQPMQDECEHLGYHKLGSGEVCLRDDLAGPLMLKTALEEVGHYVTGAGDNTRDFQQFFIDMIVETHSPATLVLEST